MKLFFLLSVFFFSLGAAIAQSPGCLDSLTIPKTLTPDGDRIDDVFSVYFPCVPEKFEVTVMNRWGEEIYTSKYPGFMWDGTHKKYGEMPMGTYHYVLTFTYLGNEKTINGYIELYR